MSLKLIKTTNGAVRVSQACDRCRIKKIKCDGALPCNNCAKIQFNCKTSDKLTRRAFPKGYTENLENKVKELEMANNEIQMKLELLQKATGQTTESSMGVTPPPGTLASGSNDVNLTLSNLSNKNVQAVPNGMIQATTNIASSTSSNTNMEMEAEDDIIDQIFNLDSNGLIIGNDNLNFESQFNSLLESYNLPQLKLTNSHNNLINSINNSTNDSKFSQFDALNPFNMNINKTFNLLISRLSDKRKLDNTIKIFFKCYNSIIPILSYDEFMGKYSKFLETFDELSKENCSLDTIEAYFVFSCQLYVMGVIIDPQTTLSNMKFTSTSTSIPSISQASDISPESLLPYLSLTTTSIPLLQTYLLSLYHSLLTNNKPESLKLTSYSNSLIGILGINLNHNNLFYNDNKLLSEETNLRVKLYWSFKAFVKIFNLKFGFRPSINTTVINPCTIGRYFELTPPQLSSLTKDGNSSSPNIPTSSNEMSSASPLGGTTGLNGSLTLNNTLEISIQFLKLLNIIIPSTFSPNYHNINHQAIYDEDGQLNHNLPQFEKIDQDLETWRKQLKENKILYHSIPLGEQLPMRSGNSLGMDSDENCGELVKIELNFAYLIIRTLNYLNFFINKELSVSYLIKLSQLSRECLAYFILVFKNVSSEENDNKVHEVWSIINSITLTQINLPKTILLQMIYLLICSIKIFKSGGLLILDSKRLLDEAITVFSKIFNVNLSNSYHKTNPNSIAKVINAVNNISNDTAMNEEEEYENLTESEKFSKILNFVKKRINLGFFSEIGSENVSENEDDNGTKPNSFNIPNFGSKLQEQSQSGGTDFLVPDLNDINYDFSFPNGSSNSNNAPESQPQENNNQNGGIKRKFDYDYGNFMKVPVNSSFPFTNDFYSPNTVANDVSTTSNGPHSTGVDGSINGNHMKRDSISSFHELEIISRNGSINSINSGVSLNSINSLNNGLH